MRFLLVHHTASSNAYSEAAVPSLLRGFYDYHTSSAKGWPDIAYNFLVDRYGRVWEGRTGSLNGPVKGDATGGSQGFALLACFIGDHSVQAPTAAAQDAMGRLLRSLAGRYGIDLRPGVTTTFTSRGSSRYPAGTVVTTPTISGHRDMSYTTCPGDACYPLLASLVAAPPSSPPPQEDELFKPQNQPTAHISAAHSGLLWDLPFLGKQGDPVLTYFSDGGIDQRWRIVYHSSGEVSFLTLNGSLALDLPNNNAFPGAGLGVWTVNTTGAQRFRLQQTAANEYRILHSGSRLRLDVQGAGGAGAKLLLWNPNAGANQIFRFVPTV